MARRYPLLVIAGGDLVAVFLSSCDGGSHETMAGAGTWPARFQSNGERIYLTGASESGTPITYTGGNMHLGMMGGGCATCHGVDRRGARMMPEFWLEAPPLTRSALFEVHDDGHGSHASYDVDTLRRAVSRGLDPDGTALNPTMPRWSMSEADWRDLLAYLSQ
jgi:mono/diheme cytochrome c family protein